MPSSKKNLAVIILAAGKGTRMKSDLPKVLNKVAGRTMIAHVVELVKNFSPQRIITVIPPAAIDVEKEIESETTVQKQPLGSGDAVKAARDKLKEFAGNVLVLYGDTPLISLESLEKITEAPLKNEIRMFGFTASDPGMYGRLIVKGNEVNEIIEFRDANDELKKIDLCNSGIYYLEAKLLFSLVDELKNNNSQKEFYLTDIVKIARNKGVKTTYLLIDENEVLGVNDKTDLARAEQVMQKNLRKKAMLAGVTMLAPDTVFLAADTKFGRNVVLRENVVIGENVAIADDVVIGPFAHIRPGTVIGPGAKIGNFVEIKKSRIGKNSKVNHLSYIGDSTLGSGVNIGAGTITCNYDGIRKTGVVIEDEVFVGANTAMVAPVTIGSGAIIGAGSTITEDVPANSLGIARAVQKNLAEWATRFKKRKK